MPEFPSAHPTPALPRNACQTKIRDANPPAPIHQNICRFQIAMQQPLLVCRCQPRANLPRNFHSFILRKSPHAPD